MCVNMPMSDLWPVSWGTFLGLERVARSLVPLLPSLQELHRAGGDIMHRDDHSRTLLHHVVSTGSKEVVRYLLDHGKLHHWAPSPTPQAGPRQKEERLPGL